MKKSEKTPEIQMTKKEFFARLNATETHEKWISLVEPDEAFSDGRIYCFGNDDVHVSTIVPQDGGYYPSYWTNDGVWIQITDDDTMMNGYETLEESQRFSKASDSLYNIPVDDIHDILDTVDTVTILSMKAADEPVFVARPENILVATEEDDEGIYSIIVADGEEYPNFDKVVLCKFAEDQYNHLHELIIYIPHSEEYETPDNVYSMN